MCKQELYFFKETQKSLQDVFGNVYCLTCPNEKSVYPSNNKIFTFYDCKKFKACSRVLCIPSTPQKPTITLFGGDITHCFARKSSRGYEKKTSPFLRKIIRH